MGRRDDGMRFAQADRAQRWPKDRIAFLRHNADAARMDVQTFRDYQQGYITLEKAMAQIQMNNYLPEVTREQFLNEYRICGWDKAYNSEKLLQAMLNGAMPMDEY